MGRGNFVCICPPKSLALGSDNQLHRAFHTLEVQRDLHDVNFEGHEKEYLFLPGGGIVVQVEADGATAAVVNETMAAFSGSLDNYAYLIKKYCLSDAEKELKQELTLNEINELRPLSEAALLCALYARLGTTVLPKLRGEFAFVVYDSKTVRVLAARDPKGSIKLWQARGQDGSLIVASGQYLPEACSQLIQILPGYFKYGWLSEPQKYANTVADVQKGAQAAALAAQRALQGIVDGPGDLKAKGKTRRGKRGGKHQKSRLSIDETRASLDGSAFPPRASLDLRSSFDARPATDARGSLDLHRGPSLDRRASIESRPSLDGGRPLRLSLDSQASSRADEHGWWRRGNPSAALGARSSLDAGPGLRPPRVPLSPLAPVFEPHTASPSAPLQQQEQHHHLQQPQAQRNGQEPNHEHHAESMSDSESEEAYQHPTHRTPEEAALAAEAVAEAREQERVNSLEADAAPSGRQAGSGGEDKMSALEQLPPGLLEKLAGPYKEDTSSVRMLANLLSSSPCALCITDSSAPDMPIIYVNRVFEGATGYAAGEVVGRNCRFLQAPAGAERAPSSASVAIRQALDAGSGKGVRLLNYTKDGKPIYNDLSIVPMRNAQGLITHHIGMQTFTAVEDIQEGQLNGSASGMLFKSKSCNDMVKGAASVNAKNLAF